MTTSYDPTISAKQYVTLQLISTILPEPGVLFDFELRALRRKGFDMPDEEVSRLRTFMPTEPQLFLIVPPRPDPINLSMYMALIEVAGRPGLNHTEVHQFIDRDSKVLTEAHLLLGVEDGRERLNISPEESLANILKEKRVPYTLWDGLVHATIFPGVLHQHQIDLAGTFHDSNYVPFLCLENGKPCLHTGKDKATNPKWGVPSAKRVVGGLPAPTRAEKRL